LTEALVLAEDENDDEQHVQLAGCLVRCVVQPALPVLWVHCLVVATRKVPMTLHF